MMKMLRKFRNRLIIAGIIAAIGAVLNNAKTDKELAAKKDVLHNKNWRKSMTSVNRTLTVTATIAEPEIIEPEIVEPTKPEKKTGKKTGKTTNKTSGKSKK